MLPNRDPARRLRRAHIAQYLLGFATGVAIGLMCIDIGVRQAKEAEPPFPVISGEPLRP